MNPTIEILTEARHEILSLRRRNEILSAKVEVFDSLMCLLHTSPAQHLQGACVDVAWQLEKEEQRLRDEPLVAAKEAESQACKHREVTVTQDGGHCNHCGVTVEYDPESRNWK